MKSDITNIHDKFSKELLSDRHIAIDFLKEFLPQELIQQINFETLTQLSDSYLTEKLQTSFADIVWRVNTSSESLQICLLLEHKSYRDDKVAFQLLEYVALAYRQQLKNTPRPELIVPVLYYHGKDPWDLRSLADFFKDYPEVFQKYVPKYEAAFINLQQYEANDLLKIHNGLLASSLLIQRHFFNSQQLFVMLEYIAKLIEPHLHKNLTDAIFVYLLNQLDIDQEILQQKLEEVSKPVTDKAMSVYEQLIQKGVKKGYEQGKEKGVKEGMEKGIKKAIEQTIVKAFDNGVSLDTIRIITGESGEKIEDVLKKNGRM